MEEEQANKLGVAYLNGFSSKDGIEILADLQNIVGYAWWKSDGVFGSAEEHNGALKVLAHIIERMQSVDKRQAADVIFKADCV